MMAAALSEAVAKTLAPIITLIINPIISLLFAIAGLYFLFGVVQYYFSGNSPDGRKKAAQHMLWGAIGLGIMLSAFGIVRLIYNSYHDPEYYIDTGEKPSTIPL